MYAGFKVGVMYSVLESITRGGGWILRCETKTSCKIKISFLLAVHLRYNALHKGVPLILMAALLSSYQPLFKLKTQPHSKLSRCN